MNRTVMRFLDVDLLVIMIVYFMVFHGETGAGIFAFGQGLIIDIFSGGLFGLCTLVYLIVFFAIKVGSFPFDLSSARGRILVIALAVLLKGILFITFLHLFNYQLVLSRSVLLERVVSAAFSGLVAPILFYLFNLLSDAVGGVEKEASTEVT